MKDAGLLLARHTGNPPGTHEGRVATLKSNLRWCSDAFEIRCWNGERVQVAFSLDCCDREAVRFVATTGLTGELVRDLMAETLEARFGAGCRRAPHPIEWLTDNGPAFTAHETREFGASLGGLSSDTMSAYSPESNGMAESYMKIFKRDYVYLPRLDRADVVFKQPPCWFDDYNTVHPHKALKMHSLPEVQAREFTSLTFFGRPLPSCGFPRRGKGDTESCQPDSYGREISLWGLLSPMPQVSSPRR
ncbi:DDE-type integrase/transposase/recombinase [Myxococcus sp. MxC21-1]|uniref:DDE-type integrase/transposase/recombinase n=1 Tax=Myxococcus sp. MxC21-1 TaxID=3041439 RepID=UPI00292EF6A3|nr:DDE-type integrase/transposase/recombinase [Myxococcus sp. MxC21-1]WNZ65828.1 DDE-type integrase/transposase/recombinase [Myxococcus sp. MxC21-1]